MANARRRINLANMAILLMMTWTLNPSKLQAGPLDPTQFTSLGTLALTTPGTYTINTNGAIPTLVIGGTTYYGVVSNGVAVFDFNSITTASGTLLTASQYYNNGPSLPVALLSRSDAIIDGRIDVSAFEGQSGTGATYAGIGGAGSSVMTGDSASSSGSGGGGFGGQGGNGGNATSFPNQSGNSQLIPGGSGGSATANLANQLQGGSGGGGSPSIAGGGGGGIEIGAAGQLTINGEVDAIGGDANQGGGGGSGGGIFLHAASVSISGTLDVQGGAGGPGNQGQGASVGGGGGGGGAILIDFASLDLTGNTILSGGVGFPGGANGSAGQLDYNTASPNSVPEPSSLLMLGTATLGLLGTRVARRERV